MKRLIARTTVLALVALTAAACGGSGSSSPATTAASPTGWRAPATFTAAPDVGTANEPISATPFNLAAHGYVEQEWFASGTAWALTTGATPSDGRWTVTPQDPAPYRTRMLVRRPSDPAKFDGNVVVEWMNVSAGETAPDWSYLDPALMDAGAAYVGVSAQALGVEGGKAILGSGAAQGLRQKDPARYGTLHHPGDKYSLDMYAQIGQALRAPAPAPLGGLRPTHVLAIGESQSAFYLTTYANAIQPLHPAYQGIFIHSRGGGAPSSNQHGIAADLNGGVRIRTDLAVPVFMFETQTDLIQLGYASARQPNTARIRTWEVAGTSHADAYELGPGAAFLGCTTPVNSGPQHEVVQAAFLAFLAWVDHGAAPPSPAPLTLTGATPAALALDGAGNALGGVRTPPVDVPVATLSGAPPAGATRLCGLFGSTVPFTPAALTARYGSPSAYLAAYTTALDKAVAAGYILPADRAALLAEAGQVTFPTGTASAAG